jgi:hypothetical protein
MIYIHWQNKRGYTLCVSYEQSKSLSWFQIFAVFWTLYIFFWVFPRRQIKFWRILFFIKPLKVGLTEGSETSAKLNLTPRKCHSSSSLWRWTWQRVPKRRQNLIWRRRNTQNKVYKSKSRHKASEDATYHIHFKKRVKLCKHHDGVKGEGNSG